MQPRLKHIAYCHMRFFLWESLGSFIGLTFIIVYVANFFDHERTNFFPFLCAVALVHVLSVCLGTHKMLLNSYQNFSIYSKKEKNVFKTACFARLLCNAIFILLNIAFQAICIKKIFLLAIANIIYSYFVTVFIIKRYMLISLREQEDIVEILHE